MTSVTDAVDFVEQMRTVVPSYCLCDLACWLCLAEGHVKAAARKRKAA